MLMILRRQNVLCAVLLVTLIGALVGCKVTDPRDPRFDPMQFDFNDYQSHEQMADVLRLILSPGMTRAEVEKYLVEVGGADILDRTDNADFGYGLDHDPTFQDLRKRSQSLILYRRGGHTRKFSGWFVYTFYDKNNSVINIYEWNERLFDPAIQQGEPR